MATAEETTVIPIIAAATGKSLFFLRFRWDIYTLHSAKRAKKLYTGTRMGRDALKSKKKAKKKSFHHSVSAGILRNLGGNDEHLIITALADPLKNS